MTSSPPPNFGSVSVDPSWVVTIVRSVWHDELTRELAASARKTLLDLGISEKNVRVVDAPGSFEIPLLCQSALRSGADGAIAFGVVLQGDTHHARLVAEQAAEGCMRVQLQERKPVTFEVLFVDEIEHARVRSIGPEGKGPLAATTLLSCLAKNKELQR